MESALDRYLKWCKTKSGQKVCSVLFIGLNVGTFSALYFPHTYLLKKYQEFMQLYKNEKPFAVPESITTLVNEVFEDLKIHEYDRKLIKPFMCFGLDTFHAGIANMKTGGIIGIPQNFIYQTRNDIENERILINNIPINFARQEAEDLANALVLSREAKKFAIGREILNVIEAPNLFDCLTAPAFLVTSYGICQWFKSKFNMYNKSLALRNLLYTVVGLGGAGLYFLQKDYFRKNTERSVDETLSKISPDYVKGGHEFYSQLLARNIAHRGLLDKHGHEVFTEEGDYAYYIRQKTLPITKRKSHFESIIKEFMQKQDKKLNSELNTIAGDVEKA